ncbi:MAG: glycosyltransferase family 87 protein [Pseudomonadota bacterium]
MTATVPDDFRSTGETGVVQGVLSKYALVLIIAYFAVNLIGRITHYALADGIAISERELIGGDFLAFWTAARATLDGAALTMYDLSRFEAALSAASGLKRHFMMWQYPPVGFMLFAPLGLFSFTASYTIWMASTAATLAAALRGMSLRWREIAIILCAPLSVFVLNAGQVSFLTTALLITAAYFPGKRPWLAGLAAGALVFKPQLAVLLPFVYVAGGHWRAFAWAAVTAMVWTVGATAIFGVDSWFVFYEAVTRIYTDYAEAGGSTPARHMTTLMSQLLLFGAPAGAASMVQTVFALVLIAVNVVLWRRSTDAFLRVGFVCTSAVMITPYAYSYELAALAGAIAALVLMARRDGWLSYERESLAVGCGVAAVYSGTVVVGPLQIPFILAIACLALLLRRWRCQPALAAV